MMRWSKQAVSGGHRSWQLAGGDAWHPSAGYIRQRLKAVLQLSQQALPEPLWQLQQLPVCGWFITAILQMDSKAAGADGIPTALLKPSLPPLLGAAEREQGDGSTQSLPSAKDAATQNADALHVVIQSISSSALVPEQWHTALLM